MYSQSERRHSVTPGYVSGKIKPHLVIVCLAVGALSGTVSAAWPFLAGSASRASTATAAPYDLSAVLWMAEQDLSGQPIRFEGPSSPVIYGDRIYANARVYNGTVHSANKLVALHRHTGEIIFETPIARSVLNSWSSPAIDAVHGRVLIGSGNTVYAIDAQTGDVAWSTPLSRSIVNASLVVTDDLLPGRAFITDFDGAGSSGSLYCLNLSPFDADSNPYAPGDIVWQEPLGGTSGNSPAYADGVVYVASVTDASLPGFPGIGHIYAFDVDAEDGQRRLWATAAAGEGFFGGVALVNGFVYAASYDTSGGQDNSTLVKLRASDGQIMWSIPCERTNSIPVVANDRIYLSAGIPGFGSVPKVQAFVDQGSAAEKLWDTFVDSAGQLVVGGWTHQPAIHQDVLYCGRIPSDNAVFGAYPELFMLDVTRHPTDPAFVIDQRMGAGSSPAFSNGRLYSIGPAGLLAIAARGDFCQGDGVIDGADIQCMVDALQSAAPSADEIAIGDFDGDGELTLSDVPSFVEKLMGLNE